MPAYNDYWASLVLQGANANACPRSVALRFVRVDSVGGFSILPYMFVVER